MQNRVGALGTEHIDHMSVDVLVFGQHVLNGIPSTEVVPALIQAHYTDR